MPIGTARGRIDEFGQLDMVEGPHHVDRMHEQDPIIGERGGPRERIIPPWIVLPGMLALVLGGVLAGSWIRPAEIHEGTPPRQEGGTVAKTWRPSPRPADPHLSLVIDYGNGAEKRFAALPWQKGITVLGAMEAAAVFRPGLTFTHMGKGESAFLTSIDRLRNSGGNGGNWIFEINGTKSVVSMDLQQVERGDAVLWRYAAGE